MGTRMPRLSTLSAVTTVKFESRLDGRQWTLDAGTKPGCTRREQPFPVAA